MASKHYYRVRIESKYAGNYEVSEPRGDGSGSTVTWTHATATAWARTSGRHYPGSRIVIERARKGSDAQGRLHPWLPYRAYVVGDDGIVKRTDR